MACDPKSQPESAGLLVCVYVCVCVCVCDIVLIAVCGTLIVLRVCDHCYFMMMSQLFY